MLFVLSTSTPLVPSGLRDTDFCSQILGFDKNRDGDKGGLRRCENCEKCMSVPG